MAKTDSRLDQARSLLLTCRDDFRAFAGKGLYGAMFVTSDIKASTSLSPPGVNKTPGDSQDPQGGLPSRTVREPGTGPRYPFPLPPRLWFKPVVDTWETSSIRYIDDEMQVFCKIMYKYGSTDFLREYRELSRPAVRALLLLVGGLGESAGALRVREVISDFSAGGGPVILDLDDANLWSLVVISLLDVEDRDGGMLLERWTRRDGPQGPEPSQSARVGAGKTERELAKELRVLGFVPVKNLFASSVTAIDLLLGLIGPGSVGADVGLVGAVLDKSSEGGAELRLMPWGDGSGVPTAGSNLAVVGMDDDGLIHVRTFDAGGTLVTDADETQLPRTSRAEVSTLKDRLPDLLPPHVLTSAEKAGVLDEVKTITARTPRDPSSSGHLGLTFDDRNRRLLRGGYSNAVDFDGKVLAWEVVRELYKNSNNYKSKDNLKIIWSKHAITDDPQAGTIQAASSELRKALRPLSLDVRNSRSKGYMLVHKA